MTDHPWNGSRVSTSPQNYVISMLLAALPTYWTTPCKVAREHRKWKQRSRLGVYLGPSPNHARSVALVLNPRTGHVPPQFHVKFDDFFETVQDKSTDMDAPEPEWKYLSGFAVKKGHPEPASRGIINDLIAPRRGPSTTSQRSPTSATTVQATPTEEQMTDILTKPLPENSFVRHRKAIMGW